MFTELKIPQALTNLSVIFLITIYRSLLTLIKYDQICKPTIGKLFKTTFAKTRLPQYIFENVNLNVDNQTNNGNVSSNLHLLNNLLLVHIAYLCN